MEECPTAAAAIKIPLTSQMFVDTTVAKAKASKVTVMVYATFLQSIMQGAMYDALMELKSTGLMTKAAKGQRLGQGLPADVRARRGTRGSGVGRHRVMLRRGCHDLLETDLPNRGADRLGVAIEIGRLAPAREHTQRPDEREPPA